MSESEGLLIDEDDILSREEIKKEAIEQMKMLNISESIINDFKNKNIISCSDINILRSLTKTEQEMVKQYEEESSCVVYHVIHCLSNIGETYELCRASCYIDDWEYERWDIKQGCVLVHSINVTHPDWSESGSILVNNINGIIKRIG